MRQKMICAFALLLLLGGLVACAQERPEAPVQRAAVPGIDDPLAVGEVQLRVLDASLRAAFQVSYIMHNPRPGNRFLELSAGITGADAPLAWGEEHLALVVLGDQRALDYSRPVRGRAGATAEYLFYYQVPEEATLDDAYLQLPGAEQIDLAFFDPESAPVAVTSPGPDLGTVAGGSGNRAAGRQATVAGGTNNSAGAAHATVGGGADNSANVELATVSGGRANTAAGTRATVGGGQGNAALQLDATVSGGARNTAGGTHATVGGGSLNEAGGRDATVAGGTENSAAGTHATVAGGAANDAGGFGAAIGGGAGNSALRDHATVAGGLGNMATGVYATTGGGQGNQATGAHATVPGGLLNEAAGAYSVAAGQRARVAAEHPGAFLFADSSATDFPSAAADEFAVRATGGVRLVTGVDETGAGTAGVVLPAGSGSWSSLSAREAKAGVRPADPAELLARVAELPIYSWHYRDQNASVQHVGPMAEDFSGALGLGDSASYISGVDADGVALAAIQGLHGLVREQETQLDAQAERIAALEARLAALEAGGKAGSPVEYVHSWLAGALGAIAAGLLIWQSGVKVEMRRARPARARETAAGG